MSVIYANGKRVILPEPIVTPAGIVKVSGSTDAPARRAVMRVNERGIERLEPWRSYRVSEGDRFIVGPDRIKGSAYFGKKEEWRREVIADQVADVSRGLFGGCEVELDNDCNWVVFSGFELPERWAVVNPRNPKVKMMMVFPDRYPEIPTNGFYLPDYLIVPYGEAHLFDRGYGGAFGEQYRETRALRVAGWRWYCSHVAPDSWRPARIRRVGDWRDGDNLWNLIVLAIEVLSSDLS